MKICDERKEQFRTTFPEVKPGDVVKTFDGQFYIVYLTMQAGATPRMVNLESGTVFWPSLWGNLLPHQVEVVENACLVVK